MSCTGIEVLPVELLLNIFEYLDSRPPSKLKARKEPSLDLTKSKQRPLKTVSYVSKRWRGVVLPLLFRNARLQIDIVCRPEWSSCLACGDNAIGDINRICDVQGYHSEMVQAFNRRPLLDDRSLESSAKFPTTRENFERPNETDTAVWAWRIHHVLEDFCQFVQEKSLSSSVQSFVLYSGRMLTGKLGRFPHQTAPREWRYPAAAAFWQQLLSLIDPKRIVLLAPPTELACLINAAIDTFGDWAFGDMDYHILELECDQRGGHGSTSALQYSQLHPFPLENPSFSASSLIHLREWTSVRLNEGSFLRAYGTYEFFERGPPSIIYSIKQCLTPALHLDIDPAPVSSLSALRKFTYTAIFPFSNHADFLEMLPRLEEIDMQLAPDPRSSILDDKHRIGKAQLQDCWQELLSAYYDLATRISTFRMSQEAFPRLRSFICRDSKIPALKDELDEIFTPLCLPVWAEYESGVFIREAMSPKIPGLDVSV